MKKFLLVLACCLLAVTPLLAKPKKKSFNNTPREVFDAALRTARERHVVSYVDEKNLMMTFQTGVTMLSYGFVANASVESEGDNKATLVINVQHKTIHAGLSFNAGDRMVDKFYEQVQEELARNSQQKTAVKPEAAHVEVPPLPTSEKPPQADGKVSVVSTPEGADIAVDGAFVGNAPSAIKLPPGKHVIAVSQGGFKTWSKEVTVFAGSEVSLKATLTKE